jgi:hypothetical protein
MRKKEIIWLLLLLTGCALLKRNTKTTDETYNKAENVTDLKTTVTTDKQRNIQQLIYRKDSADASYTIQFWPKGVLDFSPGAGFRGEFDSILMKGKQKQLAETSGILSAGEAESRKSAAVLHQKSQLKSGKKKVEEVEKNDVKLFIIILIVLVSVFFVSKWWNYGAKN